MNTYTVIMLGPSGSGKTVFLASMYKNLSTQGEHGFFLEVDGAEKRKRLNNIYTQIAVDEKWPKGTTYSEISEWTFTCRVQTENLPIYSACKFAYLDYAGGRLTDEMEEEDAAFESKLKEAETMLGLLDGQRLSALMRNEKLGKLWAINDLPNMLHLMQNSNKPIHFVISKWDVVQGNFTLEQIRDRLLQIEEFRNLVKLRNKAGTPVRLIPVSAVGIGFAKLQPDGSMAKTGELPQPFHVEVPLACILPDVIQSKLEELMRKRLEELSTPIEVKPNLSFWERLGQAFGSGLKIVQQILPKKYQFAEDILQKLIEYAEEPAQKKQEAAVRRTDELRREQAASLKVVADEETALKHVINCFLSIRNKLDYTFPESDIMLP
ncbi:hypothetical protein [Nostoc sp. 'Peltigera membranacea cyanobiont' 210A]|uniref:hypothetical protein n=1 Tax=Nostoc sp. 'Peltigera membranacea cyanobiont' 210A TaxID=2014529 RepID=UPI001CB9D0B0|nr:hypothetical protein [Nostoc sp. 'Peltigera membranacea cyanobiont' 210A]